MTQNLQGDFLVQIYVSLVLTAIFPGARWTWVSQYQNVSILYFIGAKDDGSGGDNWSYKTCKAPVKSSQPANQHPTFYKLDALPVAQLTVSEH